MPSKNIVKTYAEGGYYHLYNRGVNKQNIFFNNADFTYFLFLLKLYLSSSDTVQYELTKFPSPVLYFPENFYKKLYVVCFCLMPNHFHLIVHQTEAHTIEHFMRAFMTKYVLYVNHKYNRCGPLFQSSYKAVLITHDKYLLHLSRYIHLNPTELTIENVPITKKWSTFVDYPYSSYQWFLRNTHLEWFEASIILDFFDKKGLLIPKNIASYQSFVEDYNKEPSEDLKRLLIDS